MQANAQTGSGSTFDRIAVVRAIPGRKLPLAIVHAYSATGAELAVQEKYAPSPTGLDASAVDLLEQDARRAMALRHPNVAAVRDVTREGGEVSVVMEFVEGEVLEELRKLADSSTSFTIEVGVRIVVDVLSALSALHTLDTPGLAHGEVTTSNIIVGFEGATRLLRPYRGRVAGKVAEDDWFGYAAPEVLNGQDADARSDLFSVGVLLWETLTKKRLFPDATRAARTSRSAPIAKPTPPPDASWAAPLVAVAERALASNPQARYGSAAEMAAAVRLAVRSKLAMPPRVAAVVDKLAGERILQRRVQLAPQEAPTKPSGPARPSVPDETARVLEAIRPSSRPPTPAPGPVIVPAVPKAPPLPSAEAREARFHVADMRPGPRPTAPALKLSHSKPPKVSAAPIAPPTPKPAPLASTLPTDPSLGSGVRLELDLEPISLDGALRSMTEAGSEFGVEPPTVPKAKKAEVTKPPQVVVPKKTEVVKAPEVVPKKAEVAKAPEVVAPKKAEVAKAPEAVVPKKAEVAKVDDVLAAPPADMLDVVKAFEGRLAVEKSPSEPTKTKTPSEKPAPFVDASVITSPAILHEPLVGPPIATSVAPAGIGAQRGRRILIGVGALCALLLLGAGIRFLVGGKGSTPVATATATDRPEPPATRTAASAAPTVAASSAARAPIDVPQESAAPSASAAPTAAPEGSSRRHHPRPRPTYDPMGI